MKIKISQIQSQKTILAPSMQQSIEVLLLSIPELNIAIDQELENNPLLEIDTDKKSNDMHQLDELINKNIVRFKETHDTSNYDINDDNADYYSQEIQITKTFSLEEFLLEQLSLEITDPVKLKIGTFIIGDLNYDGYLNSSYEEIAHILEVEDISTVEDVLKTIQQFEPIGIASRNLKESLLAQANFRFNGKGELIKTVIENHLYELGHKKFSDISKKLKISIDEVKNIAKDIASLEPKPARKFNNIESNIYIKPDVTIETDDEGEYHIKLNKEYIPKLVLNKVYQNMLRRENLNPEEKEFIRNKIKDALLFIRSIEQRNRTLENIAKYILEYQKDFFKDGYSALRPMILEDVSTAINRNKSTVSRAINNKYIETPQGLYPLRFFFSQAISDNQNGAISNRCIKEELRQLIEEENKNSPLSDKQIQEYFERKNLQVARRTISKYRKIMRILPSNLRKA